ncbi:hypothetical protein [Lactococcus sp.]|uniref:hypothetical protein n=1 Tax=Lactococcus sp. TaxID=44273 RepID=UPI0035AF283F
MGLYSTSKMREALTKAELAHEDKKYQKIDERGLFGGGPKIEEENTKAKKRKSRLTDKSN